MLDIDGTEKIRGIVVNALERLTSTIDSNIRRLSLRQWLQ
jgi:hypothetical protein